MTEEINTNLIAELKEELGCQIEITEGERAFKITKGKALIKKIVNDALSGDKTMIGSVLKLAEKIDVCDKTQRERAQKEDPISGEDWESILKFYIQNKEAVDEKIEKTRESRFNHFDLKSG